MFLRLCKDSKWLDNKLDKLKKKRVRKKCIEQEHMMSLSCHGGVCTCVE